MPPERPAIAAADSLADDVSALLTVMQDLHGGIRTLVGLASDKLAALRCADVGALRECAERESQALRTMHAIGLEKRAVVARLAQRLRCPQLRSERLAEIAARLGEPFCSRITAKTQGLRESAARLQQKSRLAERVARGLHSHVRTAMQDVAQANEESIGYGPDGRTEQQRTRNWVDAVG